jgi:regulatory protein
MKITTIKQAKNPDFVNIYLDGEFWVRLHKDNLLQNNLAKGDFLTEELKSSLEQKSNYDKAYNKALDKIARRPHSKKELLDYLRLKQRLDPELIKRVTNKLEEFNFLNDEKFAEFWIESRLSAGNKSKRQIFAELLQKGIAKDLATEALNRFDEQLAEQDEDIVIREIRRWGGKIPERNTKEHQKFLGRLLRKGISYEKIRKYLNDSDIITKV